MFASASGRDVLFVSCNDHSRIKHGDIHLDSLRCCHGPAWRVRNIWRDSGLVAALGFGIIWNIIRKWES
jgi:hypothetical protein